MTEALRKAMVEERVPAAATVGVEREGDLAERPVLDADGNETAGRTADASRSGALRDLILLARLVLTARRGWPIIRLSSRDPRRARRATCSGR